MQKSFCRIQLCKYGHAYICTYSCRINNQRHHQKRSKQVWTSGAEVRISLVMPTYNIKVPRFEAQLCSCLQSPAMLGDSGDGSSSWVPATHARDLNRIPDSRLWPSPASLAAGYLESRSLVLLPAHSLCLSNKNKQIKKKKKRWSK